MAVTLNAPAVALAVRIGDVAYAVWPSGGLRLQRRQNVALAPLVGALK